MHLLHAKAGSYVFRLGPREQAVLVRTLQLYPLVPVSHHRITRGRKTAASRDAQEMLTAAMASQQREHQGRLTKFLAENQRLREDQAGWRLTLDRGQIEWLLQVLNDVRVGSWLKLGSPDPDAGPGPVLNEQNRPYYVAMEFAGYFQCALMQGVESGGSGA